MADHRPYLLGLRLAGRRVLVAGGGAVAGRRVPALLDAGAAVFLVSPEVTGSLEDLAQTGRIEWARRPFQPIAPGRRACHAGAAGEDGAQAWRAG